MAITAFKIQENEDHKTITLIIVGILGQLKGW